MGHSQTVATDAVVQHFIAELLPRLRDEWDAGHVIGYDSRARGKAHEWSGLDVVVVSPRF